MSVRRTRCGAAHAHVRGTALSLCASEAPRVLTGAAKRGTSGSARAGRVAARARKKMSSNKSLFSSSVVGQAGAAAPLEVGVSAVVCWPRRAAGWAGKEGRWTGYGRSAIARAEAAGPRWRHECLPLSLSSHLHLFVDRQTV
jgi:hypothetical protein